MKRGPVVRAREVLSRLPAGPVEGVEVGVYRGAMSAALLRLRPDLHLHMVDPWLGSEHQPDHYRKTGDRCALMSATAHENAMRAALDVTRAYRDRTTVHRGASPGAADDIEDGSLDFAFLDGDHSYEAVSADIAAWVPKLKPGGVLGGHDYADPSNREYGVIRAVDEACEAGGWDLERGDDDTWFVRP